jgi:type IV pilus assembly protein PilY1
MDGWFTTFNDPIKATLTPAQPTMTAGERSLAQATLLGGTVFFTTFIPSTDICQATGTGQLYAVYYLTGGPYTSSAIGSVAAGSNTLISKSLSLGQGLPTQMQLHIGGELPLTATGPTTPGDCAGSRVMGITQTSTGAAPVTCVKPAKSFYSRLVAWRDL